MIVFEFDTETHHENIRYERTIYWLGITSVTGKDKPNTVEIYEQIDAQVTGLVDE